MKPHACYRASPLAKRYGWGAHFNAAGKLAIYARESKEYREYAKRNDLTQLVAMRNQRA